MSSVGICLRTSKKVKYLEIKIAELEFSTKMVPILEHSLTFPMTLVVLRDSQHAAQVSVNAVSAQVKSAPHADRDR
jgi:hypothetical protein